MISISENTIVTILLGFLTLIQIGFGWLTNRIFKLIDKLQEEDKRLAQSLNDNYVRRDDNRDALNAIFDKLRTIDEKLDQKVDK